MTAYRAGGGRRWCLGCTSRFAAFWGAFLLSTPSEGVWFLAVFATPSEGVDGRGGGVLSECGFGVHFQEADAMEA